MTDSNAVLEQLKKKAISEVKNKLLVFLSIKSRSSDEIIKRASFYFKRYSLYKEEISSYTKIILQDFTNAGLISDKNYVSTYIDQVIRGGKGVNKYKVRRFLEKKGVPKNLISEGIKEISSEDEYDSAYNLGRKKMRTIKGSSLFEKKLKLKKFLHSKGYSMNTINSVVDSLFDVK